MIKVAFTNDQASHALGVVLKLMKSRRFFLYKPVEDGYTDSGIDGRHHLDEKVFAEAIDLDANIRSMYQDVRKDAELAIMAREAALGIVLPALEKNKQIVRCSRYTGGLDISHAFPFVRLWKYLPKHGEPLKAEILSMLQDGQSPEDFTGAELKAQKAEAESLVDKICDQLLSMQEEIDLETACVVLLHSRFGCDEGDKNDDFMHGKVWRMQKFSHALSYLLYKYSQKQRLVRHAFITCSTSRKSHAVVSHWDGEEPNVHFSKRCGYSSSVYFSTVM